MCGWLLIVKLTQCIQLKVDHFCRSPSRLLHTYSSRFVVCNSRSRQTMFKANNLHLRLPKTSPTSNRATWRCYAGLPPLSLPRLGCSGERLCTELDIELEKFSAAQSVKQSQGGTYIMKKVEKIVQRQRNRVVTRPGDSERLKTKDRKVSPLPCTSNHSSFAVHQVPPVLYFQQSLY